MVRQDWSDDDLAQGLRRRDPEALETLISRHSRELFYFIRTVLEGVGVVQDAEECVNDSFVVAWQEIESFDPERGTLRTWLTMRARYIALDRRRQLCRRQAYTLQSGDESRQWGSSDGSGRRGMFRRGYDGDAQAALSAYAEANMERLIEQGERREELRMALLMLPELDRQLIYLRFFKFAKTEELAAKTGLTRHAIDTRLWRARAKLREVLERGHDYERI